MNYSSSDRSTLPDRADAEGDPANRAFEALEAIARAASDALNSEDTVSLTRALEVIRGCADDELRLGRGQPPS